MSYHHILVPVDGSPTSLIAVNHAASLAKAFSSKVTLVYALTI
ncbi:universal stress protein, partial [Acinetobacter baumannii]|nr:universal stress protein [Acinetobacter baumannii]